MTVEDSLLPKLVDFMTVEFDEETKQWVSRRHVDGGIPLSDRYIPDGAKPLWSSQMKAVNDRGQANHMTQPEAEALLQIVEHAPAIHEASL